MYKVNQTEEFMLLSYSKKKKRNVLGMIFVLYGFPLVYMIEIISMVNIIPVDAFAGKAA